MKVLNYKYSVPEDQAMSTEQKKRIREKKLNERRRRILKDTNGSLGTDECYQESLYNNTTNISLSPSLRLLHFKSPR